MNIRTWRRFGRLVRPHGRLLQKLDDYPASILVSGCQRSGGTMLADAFVSHSEIVDFAWSGDAELDGALVLAGRVDLDGNGRYCFQSTYLNEEYLAYLGSTVPYKLIWLVRNPHSVVTSMLYNWKRFALNELFIYCGARYLDHDAAKRFARLGLSSVRPIVRACLSYRAKVDQLLALSELLPDTTLLPIEYEYLVTSKEAALRTLCRFVGLPYEPSMGDRINTGSLKKSSRLSDKDRTIVEDLCEQDYTAALEVVRRRQ